MSTSVTPGSNAERYEGTFVEDRRQGQGRCTFADGSIYSGEWHAGVVHGVGRFEHANGDVFEGSVPHRYQDTS